MSLHIFLFLFLVPCLLGCSLNQTYKIEKCYDRIEFHGISELGIAIIKNEQDKIADLIGNCQALGPGLVYV